MSKNQTDVKAEPGKQELFITREFDAPRELVFKVSTDPKFISQWWGPREYTMEVDHVDIKSNGSWRYIQTDKSGMKFGFHGVYHEVLAPSRIIETFEYEGLPETGHVILQTSTLDELPNNRTKLTVHMVFMSVADRDGMVMSGMERGMKESHERLDELLIRLSS